MLPFNIATFFAPSVSNAFPLCFLALSILFLAFDTMLFALSFKSFASLLSIAAFIVLPAPKSPSPAAPATKSNGSAIISPLSY